jgi:hypothetical protein
MPPVLRVRCIGRHLATRKKRHLGRGRSPPTATDRLFWMGEKMGVMGYGSSTQADSLGKQTRGGGGDVRPYTSKFNGIG